jgi:hypothetical protein
VVTSIAAVISYRDSLTDRDLEGVVAKWTQGRYERDGVSTSWIKIKNPEYSQIVGRRELFEARSDYRRRSDRLSPVLRLRHAVTSKAPARWDLRA